MKQTKSKFKPHNRYRYLPGQVSKPTNDLDLKIYNTHRLRVFMAKPIVDDRPLKLDPKKWIDRKKLRQDLISAIAIDKENKDLLKKINIINRKGGYVDTYNPIAYRRTNKWIHQERNMKAIQKENKDIYNRIVKAGSYYETKVYNAKWEQTVRCMNHCAVFPFLILKKVSMDNILQNHASISEGLYRKNTITRPLCFLEFKVRNGEYLGKIIIELYYDYAPVTVQNFLSICTGEAGLTYKNCVIHRIIKNRYLETGDITHNTGRGGFSIYGKDFREENHVLKHTKAGVLSMKRIPFTENNSQFCITLRKMESLDHKNVVFGKIIKGNDNLFRIQDYARKVGKPYAEIIISDCGEVRRGTFENPFNNDLGKSENSAGSTETVTKAKVGTRSVKNCKCLPNCQNRQGRAY